MAPSSSSGATFSSFSWSEKSRAGQIEEGKTLGPHPELVQEAKRLGKISLFWMYRAEQFLAHISEHIQEITVSPESVDKVKEVSDLSEQKIFKFSRDSIIDAIESNANIIRDHDDENLTPRELENQVLRWLSSTYPDSNIEIENDFPKYIVENSSGRYGFHYYATKYSRFLFTELSIRQTLIRASSKISDNTINNFTLLIILDHADLHVRIQKRIMDLYSTLEKRLAKFPNCNIIIGVSVRQKIAPVMFLGN